MLVEGLGRCLGLQWLWLLVQDLGAWPDIFGENDIQWGLTVRASFNSTLLNETPAGQYLVRFEHIAIHGAGDFSGAEFYFSTAQIKVESDSAGSPVSRQYAWCL